SGATMRPALFAASAAVLALAACGANGQDEPQTSAATGAPVETRPPNDPDQKPAHEGQTRAPSVSTTVAMQHAVVAEGLEHPWGLALLPDGQWLVTERPGRMRVVSAQGRVAAEELWKPGALAVLPDGQWWVTGRPGRLRDVSP